MISVTGMGPSIGPQLSAVNCKPEPFLVHTRTKFFATCTTSPYLSQSRNGHDILVHKTDTNYEYPNTYVAITVEYETQILEYKSGNWDYKLGIRQKLGGQK